MITNKVSAWWTLPKTSFQGGIISTILLDIHPETSKVITCTEPELNTKPEVKHAHVAIAYRYVESVAIWDLIVDDGL